tara:strand:- start:474 stop:782 length:309 start_codon:yes stop_codon:yes gene_type:complete
MDYYDTETFRVVKMYEEKEVIAKKLRKEFGIKKPIAFINEIVKCEYYINVMDSELKSNSNRYGNNFMLQSIFTIYVIASYSLGDYVDPIRLKEFRINIEDYK